ncbi:MAG: hypothetical protein ABII18_02235 [bacterium]|nr:hypothetical protein [bacterium]MBU1918729.1 hypothetical protein [bacterium]
MSDVVETKKNRIWVEKGIRFDEVKDNVMIILEDAQENLMAYYRVTIREAAPTLFNLIGLKSMSHDAREYLAGKHAQASVTAMALLVGAPITEITASHYIKLSKPAFPAQIFTTKEEALAWLEQYKK